MRERTQDDHHNDGSKKGDDPTDDHGTTPQFGPFAYAPK
jgi:hypothetical protein